VQPSGSNQEGAALPGRPRPSERLLARLRAMGLPVAPDAQFRRVYAGYWQRAAGAWSWTVDGSSTGWIGSIYPVAVLLRAERLIAIERHGDWHVIPWDGEEPAKSGEILESA
jgi:hypothetical protein